MPDWTYRTLLKPVLRALPRALAHEATLRSLALLARLPGGPQVLEFFGHMQPDLRLRVTAGGRLWATPIGLGAALDPAGIAGPAWARFGVGFIEFGPAGHVTTDALPAWIRLAPGSSASFRPRIAAHRRHAVGFILEQDDSMTPALRAEQVRFLAGILRQGPEGCLLLVATDARALPEELEGRAAEAITAGADGVRLDTGWMLGSETFAARDPARWEAVLGVVRRLRDKFGAGPVFVAGGAESAADVLALRAAGADLVALDAGLVRSGPGLPKRANAALLFHSPPPPSPDAEATRPPWASRSWFWCALLGASMFMGGLLALIIACTRVVLPYDEAWCSTTRDGFAAINPRLLPFMAHDRVSLAGTMISIGGLYLGLAIQAVRRGAHWARKTIVTSATAGFLSFFLFLGFGYFDPFHAFVTAILFQFLVLALHSPLGTSQPLPCLDLDENAAWRRGQWGQLLFVLLGMGLTGAGLFIAAIGVTRVFVREDLEFLGTSIAALRSANAQLIPLVAHDRASLGGMLVANGLGLWLAAQWGFAGGARGLWWTLVLSGLPAFAGAIGVHLAVGYTNSWHLAPAFAAFAVFVLAAALTHEWLCRPGFDPRPVQFFSGGGAASLARRPSIDAL